MRLVAGLDVGTTGCKVTVFTAEGENLGREYRDYPVRRAVVLTGNRVIDYSLAARTGAFDIRALRWSEEILSAAGLDASLFSDAVPTGTVAGTDADGMKVVAGGHDQVACAVGAGVFEPGIAAEGAGTVECMTPVFAAIPEAARFANDNYCVVPYFGNYVSYAYSYTGGGAKSRLWMQMKADVLGLPIDTLETEDAGTVGCAMLAGVAAGVFADLESAAKAMVRKTGTFAPDPARHADYSRIYERYDKLYRAVRPLV